MDRHRPLRAGAGGLADMTKLSHSARYALESMPGPEAEAALLQALAKTSGSNQVGIIDSLAARRDTAAVPALGKLLSDADTNAPAPPPWPGPHRRAAGAGSVASRLERFGLGRGA
jgi:hypothetical protein